MSNEERVAIEAVIRSYKAMVTTLDQGWNSQPNNYYTYLSEISKAQGKIDGCTEVLRDLMREIK